MENEFGSPLAALAQRPIEIVARPASENLRFLLRQARAHGKIGLRQVERARIIEA